MEIPPQLTNIEHRIMLVRGVRVILGDDLARMYGVRTYHLNQSIKRNRDRFPNDFMFRLTERECSALQSQRPELLGSHGGRRTLPYVFTDHGAVMLASMLKSRVAVAASIHIVRAFNRMRRIVAAHADLAAKIAELEEKYESHDDRIQELFDTIRGFLDCPPDPPRTIGFKPE